MGGNAKHMPHIWEHLDHTFADLRSLLEGLTAGTVDATEKFDGINMHFRVDASGIVRFSRNDTERKKGGVTFSKMLENFASHPARQTIIEGVRTIDEHFSSAWWPFGFSGRNWINAEIVYTPRPQLLKYDRNAIVLHEIVTWCGTSGQKLVDPALQTDLKKVCSEAPVTTLTGFEWVILPPQSVYLPPQNGEGFLSEALKRLEVCRQSVNLAEEHTLRDFLRESLLRGSLATLKINEQTRSKLADHIAGKQKYRLIDLKKGLPKGIATQLSLLGQVKNQSKVHREAMQPIINTISAFGASRLGTIASALIEDSAGEINRLQAEIAGARSRINDSDDADALQRSELFEGFMNEYNSLGGSPAPIEGLTFSWNSKKTKLTGIFSTLNQAVGVDRYGRGSIGPTPQVLEKTQNFNLAEWFGMI